MLAESFSSVHPWTALVILAISYALNNARRRSPFPFINQYPDDFLGRKAYGTYLQTCSKLITEGMAKFKGPFTIALPHEQKIVLPFIHADWVKKNKDLDHRKLVSGEFFAGYSGFEAQSALQSDDMLLSVIRSKLGQNDSIMGVMNASLANGFQILWGDNSSWHTIDWQYDTMGIIARAASSVFVGPEKAEDPEWLQLVQDYVNTYFKAVGDLHQYPPWSRPFVHWFLRSSTTCRRISTRARFIMREVVSKRLEDVRRAEVEGISHPEFNDALAWTHAASGGKAEPGDVQLSLAMAAMFTTSELFRQVLIDVACHPELLAPLRDEVSQQISRYGISTAATNNMALLDSVMKESQRRSAPLVSLERIALRDAKLPDGTIIPRGSHIMVDSTNLWDPASYTEPDQFDGYRFLRKRQAGDTSSQLIQSGHGYNVFGGGRHICPGRFFASNELKLAMAHILLKYEIRMLEGYQTQPMKLGFYVVVDPMVKLEVRRVHTSNTDILHTKIR